MWPFIPGERFPYSNFHSMNQDWILQVVKDFKDQYQNIQQLIQDTTGEGIEELEAKTAELEGLLNQWYNTHSTEIATQLANALVEIGAFVANVTASIPQDYTTLSRMASDTKDTTLDSMRQFVENLPYLQLYPLFYRYGINGDTGLPNEDNSQTHSEFIFIGGSTVEFIPKTGYKLHVRYYQNRDYNTFVSSVNNISGTVQITPANYMVLVCTKEDFSPITPQESGGNVKIYSKNIYTGFIMSNESNSDGYTGNVNIDTVNKIITFGASDSFCRLCYSGKIINLIGKTLDYSSYNFNYAYILYNLDTGNFELNGATAIVEPSSHYVIVGTMWGNNNTMFNLHVFPCYYINGMRVDYTDSDYIKSDVHTRSGDNVLRIGILGDSTSTYTGISESQLNGVAVRGTYYPAGDVNDASLMWFNQLRNMLRTDSDYIVSAISRCSFRDQGEPLQPPTWNDYRIARLKTLTNMKYLLLYCGVNEQYVSDANIGEPTYKYSVEGLTQEENTTCRGIELTIRKIQTEMPNTEIIVLIPPFTFGNTVTYFKPYTTFRAEIRNIANAYGIRKIIDLAQVITPNNKATYTIDGIHPNKAGMQRIAHYVANKLMTDNKPLNW